VVYLGVRILPEGLDDLRGLKNSVDDFFSDF
jgi:hypothetical protein